MAFMYILECSDGSYYVGSTGNIHARFEQHQKGLGAEYTKHRLPVKLVYCRETPSVAQAFAWEKKVQGWSRAKRQALIRGDWDALPGLSKRKTRQVRPAWLNDDSELPPPISGT